MTPDVATMTLIGCAFGLAYLALRHYTDWMQYNYGPLEWRKLWTATRAVWLRWTVVWVAEGCCWFCAGYVVIRFIQLTTA